MFGDGFHLGDGAESEAGSGVSREQVNVLMDSPGIARAADDGAIASPEMLLSVPLTNERTGVNAFVTVRGGGYFFLPGLRALRYLASLPG